MKTPIFLILTFLLLNACIDEPCNCISSIDDSAITIHYTDSNGNNLINSNSQFQEANIKTYFKVGDEYVNQYDPEMDNPNSFTVGEFNDALLLTVFPSNSYTEGFWSETLIELNPNTVDTLLCQFDVDERDRTIQRWFFNGEEMFDRRFIIEK